MSSPLLDPTVRGDHSALFALLACGFREFGASGRAGDRDQIVELLVTDPLRRAASSLCRQCL